MVEVIEATEGYDFGLHNGCWFLMHCGRGLFFPQKNVLKMIRNMFIFFDSFLVGKNEYENQSFFVTKYVGNFNNVTDLKILGKCYSFLSFF